MIIILVPYRDRPKHLEIFTKYTNYLFQIKEVDVRIIICKQDNDKPFNRGLVLNLGLLYLIKTNQLNQNDTIIFSDIDCICPEENFNNYIKDPQDTIRHIYGYSQLFHNIFYSLGGVISFRPNTFFKINGFPNNYWGWGCEDLALGLRAKITNTIIENSDLVKINEPNFYQFENPKEEPNLNLKLINNSQNLKLLINEVQDISQIANNGICILDIDENLPNITIFRDYEMFAFKN